MKRIFLFLATNVAILVVLSIALRVDRILDEQGANLDLRSLLIFSAVIGLAGRQKMVAALQQAAA